MTSADQEFSCFWAKSSKRVALWSDSTYGTLSQDKVLQLATEIDFPLCNFHCSYGAGLTVKGNSGAPDVRAAEVIMIELGYNDASKLRPEDAVHRMRRQGWYNVLKANASTVKFVIFVHQPSYRQVCAPRKQKQRKNWIKGSLVEGSKWTDEAMKLVEELGIQALCLTGSAEEVFGALLVTDEEGNVWQDAPKCREYVINGIEYCADGRLALWSDAYHPSAAGVKEHFRCLVKLFQSRYETSACSEEERRDQHSERSPSCDQNRSALPSEEPLGGPTVEIQTSLADDASSSVIPSEVAEVEYCNSAKPAIGEMLAKTFCCYTSQHSGGNLHADDCSKLDRLSVAATARWCGQTLEAYKCPNTESICLWHEATKSSFYAGDMWVRFLDPNGRFWWWNEVANDWFWEA